MPPNLPDLSIDEIAGLPENLVILGRFHRVRATPIGWPAIALMVMGWGWDLYQLRPGGWPAATKSETAISFAAFWMVLVLALMAAWDLFVAIDDDTGNPSLGFGPQGSWVPSRLRPAVVPVCFVAGTLLGHWFWT